MSIQSPITDGFCPRCGSILPHLKMTGNVICYSCKSSYNESVFGTMEMEYTIPFNTVPNKTSTKSKHKSKEPEVDGPVVNRKCPKCGNEQMSYATLQLRSADEGQTVFFTCTKCKYKESENS